VASNRWVNLLVDVARAVTRPQRSKPAPRGRRGGRPVTGSRPSDLAGTTGGGYVGDFSGPLSPTYAPSLDGDPDPGEVVWTWVPYEDDPTQGKDRPVLLVGHDGPWLLALQLTSKDHDRDAAQEARYGRLWMDIGSGPWDARGRPSEVRVNRVIRVSPGAVRREGAIMDRRTFQQVVTAMRQARG
jgi:hypothetical protein